MLESRLSSIGQHASLVGLQGISRFNITEAIPVDSAASIPEIAAKSGIHPRDAEFLVNHGLSYRIFERQPNGDIGHSAASRAIATVPHFRPWIVHALDTLWRTATFTVPAMEKWPGSQENNETAFNLAWNTKEPFFKELAKNKEGVREFAQGMKFFSDTPAMRPEFAVEGYDWGAHARSTVVDIGGNHGHIAIKLAQRFPNMRLIVQDRPEVIATAPKPKSPQVEFQTHDFFNSQPVKEADVYFFRHIFHNWSDKYCVEILRALIPALNAGNRVLLMEQITPDPGTVSPFQERPVRHFDLVMKELFNAKERSASEWKRLLKDADPRFNVVEFRQPEGSQLGIVVVEWTA